MKEYALFLGCTIPARQPNYELSARKSLSKLGIKLLDLPNTTCCAPPPIRSISMEAGLAIAAYNISLAEEKDLDIITLCSGCFESLSVTNRLLKENDELKERVNETLAQAEKEFRGTREVKHYLQVLVNEVGIKALKSKVIKPMNGLKVAAFYGCHILRPSELLNFDDPEKPRILDDLIKALGADSIEYRDKLKCCGGLLRGYSDELALQLAREKLKNASEAGADCIVTLCPFCFIALDMGQLQIRSKYREVYNMPIIHYAELLSIALGINPKELAIETHRVKIDKLLEKIL